MPTFRTGLLIAIVLAVPAFTSAQTTFNVTTEAGLRTALTNAGNGDTIVFGSTITLTTGDLPSVQRNITIEGGGFSLSGNNQYRGLFVAAFATGTATPQGVNVTIQNLTIQNTRAAGGAGGDGTLGGGGGAGLGGALFIANQATVTVNNVNFASNAAAGGSGGAFGGAGFSGGGGGGLGGNGGLGDGGSGAGGGGVGGSGGATGGRGNNPNGGPGILTGAAPGGSSNAGTGGAQGGGGAVGGTEGSSTPLPQGGAGGGAGGGTPSANTGAAGGFGGGGGGATATAGSVGAAGGFGGGGGGGTGGAGGFGGGGGGAASANGGGFGGGAGSSAGGGGGAGMGGAIFVQSGGALNVAGGLSINGNSVSGGSGGSGGGSGSAFGAGLFLQGSGTLNFTPGGGQTQAIADTITDLGGSGGGGSWSIAKNGAGTLVLSGANSFTGGVTVNDGTLSVAADGNLGGGGALTLNSAATLAISSSASFGRQVQIAGAPAFSIGGGQSVAWNGQITNGASAGALNVSGGGTLSLTNGANSYSGGTFVRGGSALVVTTDGVLGAAGGALTLGDAATAGTLRVPDGSVFSSNRPVALGGGAVIDTVGSSSATFGIGLSGSGSLTKNGTGTLTLNGAQSFTGPTAVLQGTFALNGSLPGSVVVYPAGTFRGAGTIGGSLTVTGTSVSPATASSLWNGTTSIFPQATAIAPSSLRVRGDLVVVNGATLGLTLTSPGTTPLVVEGHGILSGATLDLTVNDPNVTLARVTTYNAITAAQGLSVVNTNITSNIGTLFPGLQPFFTLDKTTLGVTLVDSKVPLASVATNPNALAAGESIDRARPTAAGDFADVVRELSVLDDAKLDDALKSIAGEVHGTKIRLVALDAEAFTDVVRDEISSRQRGTEEDRAANINPQGERPQWWGQFAGQHVDFETRDGADGADGNIGGAAFGLDWNFAGRWFAGGGGGYSRGTLTLDAIEASSRVAAPRVFGYAGFSAGPYSLNFGGSGAWTSYDTRRHLAFGADLLNDPIPGGLDRIAESTQEGTATDQWTEFSDNFKIRTWTYDAKVGWRHARYGRDAFKETGGQSMSLEAAAQAEHSWQTDVRFKAFRNTGGIRPHFSGSYRRELGDADTTTEVQLADKPESGFAVEGLGFGKNTTTALGGATVHSAAGIEYTLDYEARHAAGQTAQSVHFRLRY